MSAPQLIAPGISRREVKLSGPDNQPVTLWLYLPSPLPTDHPLPCVVIAAAGSPLMTGMRLAQGDIPEHLPYVRAGFAVAAYELTGALKPRPSNTEFVEAATAFRKARAGLENTRSVVQFLQQHVPQVDYRRLYAVGHSSAATLSLLVAENQPHIRGCIAYAPCTDLTHRFAARLPVLRRFLPWIDSFATTYSPITGVNRLHCPLFLFHAADDSNLPITDCEAFFRAVRAGGNRDTTFVRAASGGHYDSMIQQGIPQGIAWLKRQKAL